MSAHPACVFLPYLTERRVTYRRPLSFQTRHAPLKLRVLGCCPPTGIRGWWSNSYTRGAINERDRDNKHEEYNDELDQLVWHDRIVSLASREFSRRVIMLHSGKCPHCHKPISSAAVENVDIKGEANVSYKGVTYLCPHCRSVLSVSMDQLALNGDLVRRLLKALRKG